MSSLSSQWMSTAATNTSTQQPNVDTDSESEYEEDDVSLTQLAYLLVPILIPLLARAAGRYVTLRLLKVHVFGLA
ncbi:hypothetical protein BDR26DRAFT_938609 [Obelidium mucronatum]|nr:hypothetical protein BDR26DRAFT_938609 [Obelidium mucronatum]